jgi:enterochelin esterase-like enzyme
VVTRRKLGGKKAVVFRGGGKIRSPEERQARYDALIDLRELEEYGEEPTPTQAVDIAADLELHQQNGSPKQPSQMTAMEQHATETRIWAERRAAEREALRVLFHKHYTAKERERIVWKPGSTATAEGCDHLGGGW